jgi:hypothetical protein
MNDDKLETEGEKAENIHIELNHLDQQERRSQRGREQCCDMLANICMKPSKINEMKKEAAKTRKV